MQTLAKSDFPSRHRGVERLQNAFALFAKAVFGWSDSLAMMFTGWSDARAQRLADEQTWQIALTDPRFMADLQSARLHAEAKAEDAGEPAPEWSPIVKRSQRTTPNRRG